MEAFLKIGEVSEWFMVLVLKTSELQGSEGSNPSLSVCGGGIGRRRL